MSAPVYWVLSLEATGVSHAISGITASFARTSARPAPNNCSKRIDSKLSSTITHGFGGSGAREQLTRYGKWDCERDRHVSQFGSDHAAQKEYVPHSFPYDLGWLRGNSAIEDLICHETTSRGMR